MHAQTACIKGLKFFVLNRVNSEVACAAVQFCNLSNGNFIVKVCVL